MLGKLIKHEFKSVNRLMIPLHLGLIAITIIGRFYIQLALKQYPVLTGDNVWLNLANMSLMLFYIVALVAVGLTSMIYLSILRPRKNLFTDEGYLMHTLPVSAHAHIWSKLIVAAIWLTIDTALIILSVFTMLVNPDLIREIFTAFPDLLSSFRETFGISMGTAIAVYIPLFILSTLASLLVIDMSIAIGHSFNSHKVLSSVGVYVGATVLRNLLGTILQTLAGVVTSGDTAGISLGTFIFYYSNLSTPTVFWLSCAMAALMAAITMGVAYPLTCYFMTRKLNLE